MVQLPRDESRSVMQLAPTGPALAVTVDPTISSSTEITLNTATRFLRIYATVQDVFLKWGVADVTAANFDEVIPAGQIVDLFVATDSTGARYTAINLIERTTSASVIVIEK